MKEHAAKYHRHLVKSVRYRINRQLEDIDHQIDVVIDCHVKFKIDIQLEAMAIFTHITSFYNTLEDLIKINSY